MITPETIEKFKNLYKANFNISLSNEEATQMTTDLINLVKVLLKPIPNEIDTTLSEEGRQDEAITTDAA